MKKTILYLLFVFIFLSSSFSEGLNWTVGYDYASINKNDAFNSSSMKGPDLYFDISWVLDNGLFAGLRYDHIGFDDVDVGGLNAKVVAPVPSVNLGWGTKLLEDKLAVSAALGCGYAFVRYRLNVTDFKARAVSPYGLASVYYQVYGHFYAGLDIGYRVINAEFTDETKTKLNLSGIFYGMGLKHIY